ncbi:MAG TPA: hypothetical protein PKA82_13990 [Pyrinomonadaceae bacterium]|nr:hypothetical protein [Pyrinomonadaceae bacterium]
MDVVSQIKAEMDADWLPALYLGRIRVQRTRAVTLDIPERENDPQINYTLLGIELKVGRRRIACPDLATARYLRVFARIGSREVALPYNITKISVEADVLETSWHRAFLLLDEIAADKTPRSRASLRAKLVKTIRIELAEAGAGEVMPEFVSKASTRNAS